MLPRSTPPSEGVAEWWGWGIRPSFGRHSECPMLRSARMLRMRHSSNASSWAEHSAFDPELSIRSDERMMVAFRRHSDQAFGRAAPKGMRHVTHMSESCRTCKRVTSHMQPWDMSNIQMSPSEVRLNMLLDSFIRVTWLIHMFDGLVYMSTTHSYAWHDSFICVIQFIHSCDISHVYIGHDTFKCVTWPRTVPHRMQTEMVNRGFEILYCHTRMCDHFVANVTVTNGHNIKFVNEVMNLRFWNFL